MPYYIAGIQRKGRRLIFLGPFAHRETAADIKEVWGRRVIYKEIFLLGTRDVKKVSESIKKYYQDKPLWLS